MLRVLGFSRTVAVGAAAAFAGVSPTFASRLGIASTAGGILLWTLEVFAAFLARAYLWELCDALGTERWRRRVTRGTPTPAPAGEPPFVSLHVPAHNEPPDMVIQTATA